jgi:hypothetical protein
LKNGIWFVWGYLCVLQEREEYESNGPDQEEFHVIVAVCAVLAVSLVLELRMNRVTEAAVIEPHPGLVGWWRFDEGSGSVAGDGSGYGSDGTVYV